MQRKYRKKIISDAQDTLDIYTLELEEIEGDKEYFDSTVKKVIDTRERTKVRLKELGFQFPDSSTNFIFASHKSVPAKEIFEALKKEGIYVRWWNKPRISNHLRISIGTDEEMDALFAFLEGFLRR